MSKTIIGYLECPMHSGMFDDETVEEAFKYREYHNKTFNFLPEVLAEKAQEEADYFINLLNSPHHTVTLTGRKYDIEAILDLAFANLLGVLYNHVSILEEYIEDHYQCKVSEQDELKIRSYTHLYLKLKDAMSTRNKKRGTAPKKSSNYTKDWENEKKELDLFFDYYSVNIVSQFAKAYMSLPEILTIV